MSSITVAVYLLAGLLTLTATVALLLLWLVHRSRRAEMAARRQLRLHQEHTRALLDALPFPVAIKDRQGVYMTLNAAAVHDAGLRYDAIGDTSLALAPGEVFGDDARALHESSLQAMQAAALTQHEVDYTGTDGSPRHAVRQDSPILHDGKVVGTVAVLTDITRFHAAERAARRTDLALRDLAARVPVMIFTVNRCGNRCYLLDFLAGDPQALFDLDHEQLRDADGRLQIPPLLSRLHPESAVDLRQLLRRAMRSTDVLSLDLRAYGAEGLRWLHLVVAPQRSADGRQTWSGYFIDTTHINLRSEALLAARDAAERASKAKADFLATMSHEIRTPMNGVIGMLELLDHTRLDTEQRELLRTVEDSASVLLQILNDVLDFSKLEAGNLRLDMAPFDLRVLVDNVVGVMASHLHAKGLRILVDMDAVMAGKFRGDSVRLRQILLNLLNNAAKFTERGSVTVTLRVLGDSGSEQRLRISVSDTGIGIPAEKQPHLFKPFTQAESWTARRYGGTGLGLAICRYLVQLMDGSIGLESEPGVGTTMTITLPLPIEQREPERPAGVTGRHAIVRLAAQPVATSLEANLRALGLTVEVIPPDQPMRTGLAANLLFVDVDDLSSPTEIAARTIVVDAAGASPSGVQIEHEQIRLGANPLKWQAVTRACVAGLEPLNPRPRDVAGDITATTAPARDTTRAGRILVAEDHPVSQTLIRRQLELLGWACDVVGDGVAAGEALVDGNYSMLITDCQMPRMDGWELSVAWRRREAAEGRSRMPILAMTASTLDDETARCLDAGMDDCLRKPVQLRQLGEKIDAWMPSAPVTAAKRNHPWRSDGPPLTPEMLRVLVQTSEQDLHELERAISIHDAALASRRLHRLLGALQWFSDAPAIAEGRHWLETLQTGEASIALEALPACLDALRDVLEHLEPVIPG